MSLPSTYYDGTSPKPHAVVLSIHEGRLWIQGHGWQKSYDTKQVRWPERRTHGARVCDLPDGALIEHNDGAQWDAWWRELGLKPESPVVQWMQSWHATSVFVVGMLFVCVALWLWGIPFVSRTIVAMVPPKLEQQVGQYAFKQLESRFLMPSTIPPEKQKALQQQFNAMLQRAHPETSPSTQAPRLSFYASTRLKANAFALPGGAVVVTDDLVRLLEDDPDVLMGVLAHEWGHVYHRHGLQMAVKASLTSAVVGVVFGDISSFLATVPSVMLAQSYARDDEREADAQAALFLYRNGISPSHMERLFVKLQNQREGDDRPAEAEKSATLPIALSSHPADEERKAFFRNWRPATGVPDMPVTE